MRLSIILITLALLQIVTTNHVIAQPIYVAVSKPFTVTDPEITSQVVGIKDGTVFTFRIEKEKKDKIGMIDVWHHDDMQFVRSIPILVSMDNVEKYIFLGGMMAGSDPVVFLFYFNKADDTRSIMMAQLDPASGAVRKQTKLLSVPGQKFDDATRSDEANFVYNPYTGTAALSLQELNYSRQVMKKQVKLVSLDSDAKVTGTAEVELPVERFAVVRKMALTGNGQVVMQANDSDGPELQFSKFIMVVDVPKGTFKNYNDFTGKTQGGVISSQKDDILESQPDGSVTFFQPFTKKGVPDYGLSGILTTVFDASGQIINTKLMELKVRDIVKNDSKQVPYLVGVDLKGQWKAQDGTWMFFLYRGVDHGACIIASADTTGSISHTWFYPIDFGLMIMPLNHERVTVIPDDKSCWLLMTQIPSNIGKEPGKLEPLTRSLIWKGQFSPCTVRFDGNAFGKTEALPGTYENYYTFKILQTNTGKNRCILGWLNLKKQMALMEIGQ